MRKIVLQLKAMKAFLEKWLSLSKNSDLRQYRTKIVRQMRRQIFRQMKQKAEWILDVFTSIFVKYDGKFASRWRAKSPDALCAVLPWSLNEFTQAKENIMKLNDRFIVHDTGTESIVISTGNTEFSGFFRSNPTASFLVHCLTQETTEEEIVDKMAEKYDAPREVIAKDVEKVLEELKKYGAVDAWTLYFWTGTGEEREAHLL